MNASPPSRPPSLVRPPAVLIDKGLGELGQRIEREADRVRCTTLDLSGLRRGAPPQLVSAAVVLVGRWCRSGALTEPIIELIREKHPHVSVWVCARPEARATTEVVRYSCAGAGWLFEIGPPSELVAFVDVLRQRVRAPAPSALVWAVADRVKERVTRFIAIHCLVEAFRRQRVADVERRFGHDHKTLNAMLEKEDLVPLGHLLRAGRLGHARELERGGTSPGVIERMLGFRPKGFREMWRTAEASGLVSDGEIVIFRS